MILGSSSFTWKSVLTVLTVPEALLFPLENDTSFDQPNCSVVSMIPVCSLNQEKTFISKGYFSTFHAVDTLYLQVNCRS